jgi:hypothetical protein
MCPLLPTTSTPSGGRPFGYFSHERIEEVTGYGPDEEFVLIPLTKGERTSTYRLWPEGESQGEEGTA